MILSDKTEENVDWLMVSENEKYELGKRWLATMMGEDVSSFTDEKIAVSMKQKKALFSLPDCGHQFSISLYTNIFQKRTSDLKSLS